MSKCFALAALLCAVAVPASAAKDAKPPWGKGIVYGRDMLTVEERRAYWRELQALPTEEEKRAYWEAHIERMQRLALERGVAIERPPNAPKRQLDTRKFSHAPYFRELMTTAEQDAYRDAVWHIHDDDERNRFVSSHILRMRRRALARGLTYPGLTPYEKKAVAASGMDVNPLTAGEVAAEPDPEEPDDLEQLEVELDTESAGVELE